MKPTDFWIREKLLYKVFLGINVTSQVLVKSYCVHRPAAVNVSEAEHNNCMEPQKK